MKKIMLLPMLFLFSMWSYGQYSFPAIPGPINVPGTTTINVPINDVANSAGVPAIAYDSFTVSVDWVNGSGAWSSEADLTVNTVGGSVKIDPPTSGSATSANSTTLTFSGDFTSIYNPSIDGTLSIDLNQSWSSSNADWSNIVVTLFPVPTCPAPTTLSTAGITTTSADITWAAGASETNWNISWGIPGYTPGDTDEIGTASASMTSYQISGLASQTAYDVYVQADCGGGDESTWTGPLTLITACDAITAFPYEENFDGSVLCWNVIDANQDGDMWALYSSYGVGGSTAAGIYTDFNDGNNDDYLVSPQFILTGNERVRFSVRTRNTNESDDFRVVLSSTGINPSDFNVELLPVTNIASTTYEEFIINLDQHTGAAYIAIHIPPSNTDGYYFYVDDFVVETIPSCPAPTFLILDSVTATTADISWTAGFSETNWNISWGTPGFTPGDSDELGTASVGMTNYQITALAPQTTYDFYVQADCGGDESTWAGPFNFKTACDAVTSLFEDFDSYGTGSIVPDCWDRMVPATAVGSQTITATSPASGTRNIYQYASSTSNPVIVVLPSFSNINAGTHWLRFKARVGSGAPGTLSVGYVTDVSDYSSFTLIQDLSITNTSYAATDSEYTVAVPSSVPLNARMAIKNANDGKSYYWDDVYWEIAPSCLPPTALATTAVGVNTADISWAAGDSETNWNISWGTSGYTPGDSDEIGTASASLTSYQIAGLTTNTSYDVYVQADCGSGDTSTWVGPYSFVTKLLVAPPHTEGFATATTPVGWNTSGWSIGSTRGVTGNPGNNIYKNIYSALTSGSSFTSVAVGPVTNDMVFSFDYIVAGYYSPYAPPASGSGNFVLEVSLDFGETFNIVDTVVNNGVAGWQSKMYLLTGLAGQNVMFRITGNWVSGDYDMAFDNFAVQVPPTCLAPTAPILDSVTTTTADISWTAGDTETNWNISWGTPGYTPGDTDEIGTASASMTSYQISGLAPQTTYDMYVQADCGGGDESTWTGPLSFTTDCVVVSTFYEDFETTTGTNLPNCWSKVGATGSVDTRANTKLSGSRVLYVYNNVTVALPTVDNASAGTHQMAMDVIGNISPGATIEFGYLTNATDASSFISISSIVTNSTAVAQEFVTIPVGMPTGDVVFAIYAPGGTSSLIDNVRWEPIPSCPAPTALSATGITLTSVDISWTAGASETNWNISWGTPGYIPGDTDEIGTASASMTSYQISGLAPQTTYDVYVQADCGGGDESTWTGPMTFNTLVENDNLCNALPLTLGASSAGDAYTTVGATAEPGEPNGSCWFGTASLQSVWFSFVAPTSGNVTATTDILGGTLTDTHIAIYEAPTDCTDLSTLGTEVGCDEDGGIIVGNGWTSIATMTGLTPGDTYYIQVDGYGSSTGTFGIEVHDDGLDGFVYENGSWTPNDPSGVSTSSDNIYVIDGLTTINVPLEVKDIHVMSGATLRIENVLTLHGDMTIDGDLVFGSSFSGNGELAGVPTTSTITGEVTVEHYMQDRRSYRMVASSVTTTTSIHDNWQEGATSRSDNPNPGYGTHITGSTIDQFKGFDATDTGNASMFEVDIPNQSFVAIDNTNATTLAAGHPYLLYVRGDRTLTNITTPDGHTATTLRARGQLFTGERTETYPTSATASGQFVMFGNPYQSAIDVEALFANAGSNNVNDNHYWAYDVTLGDYGNYVLVDFLSGTNPSGSVANKYLQAGQAAQFATLSNGSADLQFTESIKAPGNYTANNAGGNGLMAGDMLNIQLYTAKNFNEGGSVHDGMALLFNEQFSNSITATDAPKAFGFGENLAVNNGGSYLTIERREMPVAGEVYSLYTSGYNHQEYVLKLNLDGLADVMMYLDDNYTGTSTLLNAGINTYSFEVGDELSRANDRFSIRVESLLNVNDYTFSGVRLYPNPLNAETFYIHAPMLNGKEVAIHIADMSGRQIYNRTLSCTSDRIEVAVDETLSSGVYLVTVNHEGEYKTYRLIRE